MVLTLIKVHLDQLLPGNDLGYDSVLSVVPHCGDIKCSNNSPRRLPSDIRHVTILAAGQV